MPRGGYRKPANPAPVSGPGALSRRTDGKQPVMNIGAGGNYGDAKDFREIQGGATMQQQAAPRPQTPTVPKVTPLFAPTERPDEPITSGMPFGEGPNTIPGGRTNLKPTLRQTILRALQTYDDPDLETAYHYMKMSGEI